jgi:uncharacterized protein (DUF2147 family)
MKTKKIVFLGLAFLLFACTAAFAQNPDAILGKWLDGKGKAHIDIYKAADGKYFGKIVWLKEPTYPQNDEMKMDGQNPDPAKRKQPILGLVILRDFTFSGGKQWENGRIYDPENGKDYKSKMTLISPDALDVRGFIGFSLIGRTEHWTRVKESTQ